MKQVFYPFVLLLAASIIFTGCRNDDNLETGPDLSASISTTSPWTSSVRETTATRTTAETTASTRSSVDWLTFSPQSGGAGTHTININLAPNQTGASRSANIIIESYERVILLFVHQLYSPGVIIGEMVEQVIERAHIEMTMNRLREFVNGAQTLYYELDNQFSTLTSRLPPHYSSLMLIAPQFWSRSYNAILYAYRLLYPERIFNMHYMHFREVFLANRGEVLASKGLTYFYLNTKFGGVPIIESYVQYPSRASWSEVSEFIRTTLHEAIPLLECSEKIAKCWRVLALIALQKEEYQQAMGYLQQSIGVLSGIHIPTYLLYAETRLKIGQKAQAIARVNQVLQETGKELLPSDATDDEIFAAIKANFPDEDTGMKYINAVRWGTWGAEFDPPMSPEFRKFLPIPQRYFGIIPNLVQNPGW